MDCNTTLFFVTSSSIWIRTTSGGTGGGKRRGWKPGDSPHRFSLPGRYKFWLMCMDFNMGLLLKMDMVQYWREAIQAEFDALQLNNTWTLVKLSAVREVVGCKWLFRIKKNPVQSKTLYGLCQAPRNFHDKLKEGLVRLGFFESRADVFLFVKNDEGYYTYILVYMDDIIITNGSLHVKHREDSLVMSQRKYILELLEKTSMSKATPTVTPMVGAPKMSKEVDVAFSVNKATQFMHAPRESHLAAVKRILKYFAGTLNYGLTFLCTGASFDVVAFADADWGGSLDDRRYVSSHAVFLGTCPVIWCSRKHKTVSRSTMEVEYRSVADAATEVTCMSSLLCDLGVKCRSMPIVWCDNTSAVALSKNSVYYTQSKHVDMDVHFVRKKVATKQIQMNYVPATHQVADGLTKPLTKGAFELFRENMIHNFNATLDVDPTMQPSFATKLRSMCPAHNKVKNAGSPLDSTNFVFDNAYYKLLLQGKSVFSSNQALLTAPKTKALVS
ncbi:hypothetical protein F3Y22_tig00003725pilonHSYRG00306 [Hibiscus syriacus]|uniref:Plant heme peroxidase family profile domain-containing protein n=1 Tax=Hibiscus syriacus TaxID=106335 RepID=A0A6A3CQ80_HIBSY|nr:hypothetical protein F3Y22_tig00003725pilonHSYRG00306 [Hibiscus syriacus]